MARNYDNWCERMEAASKLPTYEGIWGNKPMEEYINRLCAKLKATEVEHEQR